jgi:hypothetical protein
MPMYFNLDGRDQLVLAGLLAKLPTVEESDWSHRIRRLYVRYSPNLKLRSMVVSLIGPSHDVFNNSFECCCEK